MAVLIAAATALEMQAYAAAGGRTDKVFQLITGIGLTETALSLASMLHHHAEKIDLVLYFGIAGAYPNSRAKLLDICLAEQEVLGDLGLCLPERIGRCAERGLAVQDSFPLDPRLRQQAEQALQQDKTACKSGLFVTVNCASGTRERAAMLERQFQAVCENMEGAAAARVCNEFALPVAELRCISNMAGQADKSRWRLDDACVQAGRAAAIVTEFLLQDV